MIYMAFYEGKVIITRLFEEKRFEKAGGLSFCLSVFPSSIEVDILWAQILLQFYTDSFDTSLMF